MRAQRTLAEPRDHRAGRDRRACRMLRAIRIFRARPCRRPQSQGRRKPQKRGTSPAIAYVSDASGVQQLWKVAGGVASRLTFSNAVDKDPHSAAGHLVFASYRDGDEEIYMAKNDLSGLKRLTTSSGEDEQPKLSPNGSRIAFVSYRSGSPRIWTMDSTGANQTALATGSESYVPEMAPSWSPDGTKLVYTSTRSGIVAGVRDLRRMAEHRCSCRTK